VCSNSYSYTKTCGLDADVANVCRPWADAKHHTSPLACYKRDVVCMCWGTLGGEGCKLARQVLCLICGGHPCCAMFLWLSMLCSSTSTCSRRRCGRQHSTCLLCAAFQVNEVWAGLSYYRQLHYHFTLPNMCTVCIRIMPCHMMSISQHGCLLLVGALCVLPSGE
jgi:hypothetical protein